MSSSPRVRRPAPSSSTPSSWGRPCTRSGTSGSTAPTGNTSPDPPSKGSWYDHEHAQLRPPRRRRGQPRQPARGARPPRRRRADLAAGRGGRARRRRRGRDAPPSRPVRGEAGGRRPAHVRRRASRRVRDRRAARSVPLPADGRRPRPVPARRGQPPAPLGRHGGTADGPRRGARHRLLGVGALGQVRRASSATGTAGTAAPTRCARWVASACGSCSCPTSGPAPTTSSRSSAPTATSARRPIPWRVSPRCRRRRRRSCTSRTTSGATTTGAGIGQARDTSASQRLTVYECHLGSWMRSPDDPDAWLELGRPRPAPRRPRRRPRLHATSSCCR